MVGVRGFASAPPPRFRSGTDMLVGGAEVAAEALARHLAKRGHEVTVFTRGGYEETVGPGLRTEPAPFIPGRRTEALSHSVMATLKLSSRRYDVAHFHAVGPGSCAVLTRLRGLRSVVTVQGIDWERGKWVGWEQHALRALGIAGIRAADQVTAVAPSLVKPLEALGARNVTCVPNGYVPLGPGNSHTLAGLGLTSRRYHLMMTRLVPEKNVGDVIRAYGAAPRVWPMVIAGGGSHSGEYVESLRHLIEQTPGVRFVGPVHGPEKATLITEAGSFLNASSVEGLSLALLEALGAGVPVGISRISGNLDIFTLVGRADVIEPLSFSVGDTIAIARVLGELESLTPAGRATWSRIAPLIEQRFSWDRIAVAMESVYRRLPIA